MKFREFQEMDWNGYCDATKWIDGKPPLIGDIVVDGENKILVCDRVGIDIDATDLKDEEQHFVLSYLSLPSQALARVLLEGMPENTTKEFLLSLGFIRY